MWESKVQFCPLSDWGFEPRSSTLQRRTIVPEHIQVSLSLFDSITAKIVYEEAEDSARKTECTIPLRITWNDVGSNCSKLKREINPCSYMSQMSIPIESDFTFYFCFMWASLSSFTPFPQNCLLQLPICKMITELYSHITGCWYLWNTQTPLCWKSVAIFILFCLVVSACESCFSVQIVQAGAYWHCL